MTDQTLEEILLVLGESPAARLDKALAQVAPEGSALSRSKIVKMIESGQILGPDGQAVGGPKDKPVPLGEYRAYLAPETDLSVAEPEDIPLDIIFEDDTVLVVNKPVGMVVHPAPGSESGTLLNALLHHLGQSGADGPARAGIVHRIDKDTSGLLVVAKTEAAHQHLAAQFADHSIDRVYTAFCYGVPSVAEPRLRGISGIAFEEDGAIRIATNLARHKTDRKRQAVTAHSGRHAITRVYLDADFGRAARIKCRLQTGRTHQIRVHLAHIGHGLIGDPVYGRSKTIATQGMEPADQAFFKGFNRQALHAGHLGFEHPKTGQKLQFEAPLPPDLMRLTQILMEIAG